MGDVIAYLNAKHVLAPGNWDLVASLASECVNQACPVKFTVNGSCEYQHVSKDATLGRMGLL